MMDRTRTSRRAAPRWLVACGASLAVLAIAAMLLKFALSSWLWIAPEKRGHWTWAMHLGIRLGIERKASYLLLAEYYEERGSWDKCLMLCRKAARAFPKNEDFYDGIMTSLIGLGRFKEAESKALADARRSSDPGPLSALTWAYRRHGMRPESIASWRRVVQMFPAAVPGWDTLIMLQIHDGHVAEAQASLKAMLEANPSSADAWIAAAGFYKELGQVAETRRAYQTAIELDPRVHVINDYLDYLFELGDEAEAVSLVKSLPEMPYNTNESYRRALELARQQGREGTPK